VKIQKIEVICPECGHTQQEIASAISSYCRRCSAHLNLEAAPAPHEQVVYRTKMDRKRVLCRACGHLNSVHEVDAHSNCTHCGETLDMQDYHLKREHARLINTYGKVVMEKRGAYHQKRLRAREMETAGQVSGELILDHHLHLLAGAEVHAVAVKTPQLVVSEKGRLQADLLLADTVTVHGHLHAGRVVCRRLLVEPTGEVEADAVCLREAEVRTGGRLAVERFSSNFGAEEEGAIPSPPPVPSATADPPAG